MEAMLAEGLAATEAAKRCLESNRQDVEGYFRWCRTALAITARLSG
jgi:hypothetical protein